MGVEQRVGVGEQLGGDELLDDRARHVDARTREPEPLHERRARADPADPQAGPERLAHRADRDDGVAGGVVRGHRRGRRASARGAARPSSRRHERRPRRARERDELLAVARRQRVTGRVVEVGDRYASRGAAWRSVAAHMSRSQPSAEHRHGHRPGADRADRVERVRIRRVVDHHAVARSGQHAQQQHERVLGAGGHEHLVRRRRHAAAREVLGDRGAQRQQPERVVARPRAGAAGARRSPPRAPGAAHPRAPGWPRC